MFKLDLVTPLKRAYDAWFSPEVSVEEIHRDFKSQGEKLLADAKRILSENVDDRSVRLSMVGFTGMKELKDAYTLNQAKAVKDLVEYLAFYYPQNPVISQDQVAALCKKYRLFQGEAWRYKGEMPERNLVEIEKFIFRKEDLMYGYLFETKTHTIQQGPAGWSSQSGYSGNILQFVDYQTHLDYMRERVKGRVFNGTESHGGFKICAPSKDFDLYNSEIQKGYLIAPIPPKDPIVLAQVPSTRFNGKTGALYMVVTAWGAEAKDPLVQSPNKN